MPEKIEPNARQKEILDRIIEQWEKADQPIEAHKLTKSVISGVTGAMIHSFVNFNIPPTVLLDTIMNTAAEHIAGLLATLVSSDIITEGEAREMIKGSGAAMEKGVNVTLTRLHDQMQFMKMMAEAVDETKPQ